MEEWHRGDAEMAIALKRAEIDRALSYKTRYDADGHNICLALLRYRDGGNGVLAAYSNDSAIPESLRLGLALVPNLYPYMPREARFGCDGMAQFHTEPKLLNFISATPAIRERAVGRFLPRNAVYRGVLAGQREEAQRQGELLRSVEEIASVTLVTEIDCCPTCRAHSLQRFRQRFPGKLRTPIELGKSVKAGVSPRYQVVRVTTSR